MINIAALNPIAVHWGPFQIHWYGVIIATGVILALIMSVREGRRRGIPEDDFYDYLLWAFYRLRLFAQEFITWYFSGHIILSIQTKLLPFGMVESQFMELF